MFLKQYSHVSIEMTAHYLTLQEEEVKEILDIIHDIVTRLNKIKVPKPIRLKDYYIDNLYRTKKVVHDLYHDKLVKDSALPQERLNDMQYLVAENDLFKVVNKKKRLQRQQKAERKVSFVILILSIHFRKSIQLTNIFIMS